MKRLMILFCLSAVAVHANPTIIPLPELNGVYTNGVGKTTGFDSGLEFTDIDFIELHLRGSYTRGLLLEVGTGQYHTHDFHLTSSSPLDPELWSTDIQALNEGYFEWVGPYSPLTQGANWDFMLDGHVEVRLEMLRYAILLIYSEVIPVSYHIQEAYLEVWAPCNAVTVQHPNTREYLLAGSTCRIEWSDCRDVPSGSYLLSYSADNGINWSPVSEDPVTSTFYDWQVPETAAEHCLIKVEDADGPLSDTSDAPFAVYDCPVPPQWDLTGDCYINLSDYQLFASSWLLSGGYTLTDLESFAQNWLDCMNTFDPACGL